MISGFKFRSFFSADVFAPDIDKHNFILKLLDTRFATKKKKKKMRAFKSSGPVSCFQEKVAS